jgi:hypothetical protein
LVTKPVTFFRKIIFWLQADRQPVAESRLKTGLKIRQGNQSRGLFLFAFNSFFDTIFANECNSAAQGYGLRVANSE